MSGHSVSRAESETHSHQQFAASPLPLFTIVRWHISRLGSSPNVGFRSDNLWWRRWPAVPLAVVRIILAGVPSGSSRYEEVVE
jgi:hypothetical protein